MFRFNRGRLNQREFSVYYRKEDLAIRMNDSKYKLIPRSHAGHGNEDNIQENTIHAKTTHIFL